MNKNLLEELTMGTNQMDPTQLNNRLLKIILALGIITFITSIIGLVKYSFLSHWFHTGLILGISLTDPKVCIDQLFNKSITTCPIYIYLDSSSLLFCKSI